MSNGWLTIVTAEELFGLIPFVVRAAYSSNWLPQHQTPTFLCAIALIELMPESFQVSSVMPERVNTWAMFTSCVPASRVARRLGSQSRPNCAWPPATTCSGVLFGPPRSDER